MLIDEHVMVFIDDVLDMLRLEYPDVTGYNRKSIAKL